MHVLEFTPDIPLEAAFLAWLLRGPFLFTPHACDDTPLPPGANVDPYEAAAS